MSETFAIEKLKENCLIRELSIVTGMPAAELLPWFDGAELRALTGKIVMGLRESVTRIKLHYPVYADADGNVVVDVMGNHVIIYRSTGDLWHAEAIQSKAKLGPLDIEDISLMAFAGDVINTFAQFVTELYGGSKDRLPLTEISPGVWSHFDVQESDETTLYWNLDFTPREYEYFDMFANWFQIAWKWIRDGADFYRCARKGKSGPHIDCWQDMFKLSTFTKEKLNVIYTKLPMDLLRHRIVRYWHVDDKYQSPILHIEMRINVPTDKVHLHRTGMHALLLADESGDDVMKKYMKEHGVNLCINFDQFLCTVIEKDGELYYRPLGRDYYVTTKPEYKQYYQPRPVLQVLDSLTGLVFNEQKDLLCKMDKNAFGRWINRGVDGFFVIFIPSNPHIPVDEMTAVTLTYFPFAKKPADAAPIR